MQNSNYSKVMQFIQKLHLKRNTTYRGDCPACLGKNTFSATNSSGKIKYYCFKLSCKIKGIKNMDMSLEDIKAINSIPQETSPLYLKDTIGWSSNVKAVPKVYKYLIENNCIDAFEFYPNRFFYDRVKDRIVFCEYDTVNSFKLATGRSLNGSTPKWYKYIALPHTYFFASCLSGDKEEPTVIVEDCASACSVSRVANGLALCGTYYNPTQIANKLERTKDVIICLDPDAQIQALKLQRDLLGIGKFRSVKVVYTNDIKYISDTNDVFDILYKGE